MDLHVFDGIFQGSRSHLIGVFGELTQLCPEFDFFFFLENTDELGKVPGFSGRNVQRVFMSRSNPLKRLGVQLPRLKRKLDIDLLHTQYIIPFANARGNAVTIHDVLFEPYPHFFGKLFVLRSRLLMRWSARAADLLYTVSEYSRQEIARCFKVEPSSIEVLHNAVDKSIFFSGNEGADQVRARGLEPGCYLLTVGRIEPRKNHAGLIKAYAQLAVNPPPLVIIGQRDFGYEEFEAEMKRLPAGHRVIVFPDVSDDELPAFYRHAQLFVYPSFAEGFGMPPLEAMASGVAVLTSRSTAIVEVVGEAGWLIDPHNTGELSAALANLVASPALRADYARLGLERAKKYAWRFSAEVLAASYRNYFRERYE